MHGISAKRETKFNIRKIFASILITVWLLSNSACARPVVYPRELTATAAAEQLSTLLVIISTPLPTTIQEDPPSAPVASPEIKPTSTPVPSQTTTARPPILYYSQSGDTLYNLSVRFGVWPEEITSPQPIPAAGLIDPNQLLVIPDRLENIGPDDMIMPDSEIVFSPSALDFDIASTIDSTNGYIKSYREYLDNGWYTSAQVVARVAYENSINPRILLSIIEREGNWVTGQPRNLAEMDYPAGWKVITNKGLYRQLNWAARQLSIGYYDWRAGLLTELVFNDKTRLRLSPGLNAGSVAVQYLFSQIYNQAEWREVLYTTDSFTALHTGLFGDPWLRARSIEPLFPPRFSQPELQLPFKPGRTWTLTGGPHYVWFKDGGPMAALDFAPPSDNKGCGPTDEFATAVAAGIIVRSANGIVVLDLDGDGKEQTGWSIFYLHIANRGRIPLGTYVNKDDPLGYPSCEGGKATGVHIHIARKYNGEWILADGPVPFNLSSWIAHNGSEPYKGTLTRDGLTVIANTSVEVESLIKRPSEIIPTPTPPVIP
jgi:LasA protease